MVSDFTRWLRSFTKGLTYLVYPNVCWVCGRFLPVESALICPDCVGRLVADPHPTCPRCSSSIGPYALVNEGCAHCRTQTLHFHHALRLGPYEGLLREVILRMKSREGEGLAEAMAKVWAMQVEPRLQEFKPHIVIPVPLHWTRFFARGYNQSDTLARHLALQLKIPLESRWLRRCRYTHMQTRQPSPAARQRNVHGAFAMRAGVNLTGKTVVLVDDVLTTGATASEAARALAAAKPERIVVAVLAHGR